MADLKISQLTGATTPLAGTEVVPLVQSSSTKKVAVSDLTAGRVVDTAGTKVTGSAMSSATIGSVLEGSWPWQMWRDTESSQSSFVAYIDGGFWYVASIPYANRNSAPSGTSTTRFQVRDDGNVTINTNNLIFGTAAKGVNFTANTPAAGMTSQLLNWYEEGTWTPALAFGGASTGITYNAQAGTYTRIGRLVHCFARLSLSSKGSASGSATISGLPFTSASGDASNGATMQPSLYAGMANLTGLSGYVGASSTTINLGNDGATETGGINATNFTDSTTIYFSVQYYV